ncbi:type II toxin-antitoxin system HicB family antitoxin [Kribbella sp. NPDC049174]|uniref:type II toxin-antitoxin system HicB family antitoxin n=1 Tax=Kribbella sp. NPDC049174 TaxID=3364112 RepID=UPI003717D685
MKHEVTVPYTIEQDENGVWCAQAALLPDAFANGQGDTREAAIEDLRAGMAVLAEEVGVPQQLTVVVETPR